MPEYDWLRMACAALSVSVEDVLAHRVYTDESGADVIALVVVRGQKYIRTLESLIPHEVKAAAPAEEIPGDELQDAPAVDLPPSGDEPPVEGVADDLPKKSGRGKWRH